MSNDVPWPPNGDGESLGLAISGGGVRAAFFSLGSLMYLVNSGLRSRVRLISSVSGGSILNATVAAAGDFTQIESRDFMLLAMRVGSRMAKKGVFFWPGLLRLIPSVLVFALWAPVFLVLFGWFTTGDPWGIWSWSLLWILELAYVVPMTIYLVLYILLGRRSIQQAAYSQFLTTVLPLSREQSKNLDKLSDLPVSTVAHVLCATELTSGQPFFMSRDMVLSPRYGQGDPLMRINQAIYASAAFPLGFPPQRLSSQKLGLSDGQDEEPPRRLELQDGGVFNNLGTETFSADAAQRIYLPDPSLAIIPAVDRQFVVNASAPPRKVKLTAFPGLRFFRVASRVMTVMYENTLRPRVEQLMAAQHESGGPIVVDISESPVELARRLGNSRLDGDPVGTRARDMQAQLEQDRTSEEWKAYADRAARTKTVLSPVGRTAAVRLVRLGYLDTAIACHAHFESVGIAAVPTEGWFTRLIDGNLSENDLDAVSAPAA